MFEYVYFSKVRHPNVRGVLTKESISNSIKIVNLPRMTGGWTILKTTTTIQQSGIVTDLLWYPILKGILWGFSV